jgi:Kef-type K+ transport system membrane component KefB
MARRLNVATHLLQLAAIAVCGGLAYETQRLTHHAEDSVGIVVALGLLLICGTLAGAVLESLRIPHLTAYLAVGGALVFAAVSPFLPFVRGAPIVTVVGVSLLWGVLTITRSPAATLAILSQTRAEGPLATFSLAFVMLSDVVVIVIAATVIAMVKPLLEPGASLSLDVLHHLGHEIVGSVSLGTSLGLLMVLYLRLVNKQIPVVLVALGFGFTEVVNYVRLDPLLTFLVAGFLVQNLSKQGDKLLHAIEDMGSVVYVVFFATAGAALDVPLLRKLWLVALALFFGRLVLTVALNWLSCRMAKDPPVLRRWGWTGLVAQAGVVLGLAVSIERAFPSFGPSFRALAIAAVALNQLIGPILFKVALDATGESARGPEPRRAGLAEAEPAS